MKKRVLVFVLVVLSTLNLCACGSTPAPVVEETKEEAELKDENTEEISDVKDDRQLLTDYMNSTSIINFAGCKSLAYYDIKNNRYGVAPQVESGVIGMKLIDGETPFVIQTTFDSTDILFSIEIVKVENGQVVNCGGTSISDLFEISDEWTSEIFLWNISPVNDSMSNPIAHIAVETRETARTFADGIGYRLSIYSISSEGVIEQEFNDYLAGSGDDDITRDIRTRLNEYFGSEILNQNAFEDIFYYGNTIGKTQGVDVISSLAFSSYANDKFAEGDYEGGTEYANGLFELGEGEIYEWGEFR